MEGRRYVKILPNDELEKEGVVESIRSDKAKLTNSEGLHEDVCLRPGAVLYRSWYRMVVDEFMKCKNVFLIYPDGGNLPRERAVEGGLVGVSKNGEGRKM